ncbi:TPA: S-methyl-5'-thioadenosine phosphorylase [Candidatus Bathyarchaeota archaeon]|nr:S-methyl-5'-thioadenosine phosphorylase [Candidatus Bathyarchaeota archaeon]
MSVYGLIGGTGLETLLKDAEEGRRETPYGPVDFYEGEMGGRRAILVPRHGKGHSYPPHRVPYRANMWLLRRLGVGRIIALNAVGAINPKMKPGVLVVPHDFVDFTKGRPVTFYDTPPVTHVDMSTPYCPEVRRALIDAVRRCGEVVWDEAVMVCTEGPRFETPAEIRMFRAMGCDIVGMTGAPEATLARELGMCYATLCLVSNMAAGMQERLTAREVVEMAKRRLPVIRRIAPVATGLIPPKRGCACKRALEEARVC